MNAMDMVRAERQRQIDVEGWTLDHDDDHDDGAMLQAAVIYLHWGTERAPSLRPDGLAPLGWPWDAAWWKPKDRRSNLIRAGALMLAEKERLGRIHWREPIGFQHIHGQPFPASVYRQRIGMPTSHVDQKLDICLRELSNLQ